MIHPCPFFIFDQITCLGSQRAKGISTQNVPDP